MFCRLHLRVFISFLTILACSHPLVRNCYAGQMRIVVLPGYAEDGTDVSANPEVADHYRRVMRFINNQLNQHGFEVINPTATELPRRSEKYEDKHEASLATCIMLNQKYGTDAAYIIWLDLKLRRSSDGLCRAQARVDGEGYDSSGRDLGAGLAKTHTTVRRSCSEAITIAEKEIGYLVGRTLTAHQGQ